MATKRKTKKSTRTLGRWLRLKGACSDSIQKFGRCSPEYAWRKAYMADRGFIVGQLFHIPHTYTGAMCWCMDGKAVNAYRARVIAAFKRWQNK